MKRVLYALFDAFLRHVGTSKTDVFKVAKNGPFLGPPGLPGALRGAQQAAGQSVFGQFFCVFFV